MTISVILPTFNAAGTVAVQLEALAGQDYQKPWELIVSDNGSQDSTVQIAKQFRHRIPCMQIIDASARPGAGYARNRGVLAAGGEAIAFCDDDDEVAPNWLSAMAEALSKQDFVAGRLDAARLNPAWVIATRPCPQTDGLQNYTYPPFLPHAASANLGIKQAVHGDVGGFDESMLRLQDTDYCWRVQLAGTPLYFEPEALVHYRFPSDLKSLFRQSSQWGEYNVLLYKKYRGAGMPHLSLREGIAAWLKLLRMVPQLRHEHKRIRWFWQVAWRLGRLRGSIKYRVLSI